MLGAGVLRPACCDGTAALHRVQKLVTPKTIAGCARAASAGLCFGLIRDLHQLPSFYVVPKPGYRPGRRPPFWQRARKEAKSAVLNTRRKTRAALGKRSARTATASQSSDPKRASPQFHCGRRAGVASAVPLSETYSLDCATPTTQKNIAACAHAASAGLHYDQQLRASNNSAALAPPRARRSAAAHWHALVPLTRRVG